MSVRKDPSGRREVSLELDVPGTPEQVWQAIATGPGMSAWFMPTKVEERVGGGITVSFDESFESTGTVTAWDPPHRFAYEESGWAPGGPPLATELTIEARARGMCRLRLVHSLFATDDAWDDQLESMESGWPWYFEVLRLYLGSFAGQPAAAVRLMRPSPGSEMENWNALTGALGLDAPGPGDRPVAVESRPMLDGIVKRVGSTGGRMLLMTLERPAEGAGFFAAYTWGDQVSLMIALYLFGNDAPAVAAREESRWKAFIERVRRRADAPALRSGRT
jgi:uncharacterized protein YndB with AHSA1/START domain